MAVTICLRLAFRTFILTSKPFIPKFYGLLTLELCILDADFSHPFDVETVHCHGKQVEGGAGC